jgi:hypothetical protein
LTRNKQAESAEGTGHGTIPLDGDADSKFTACHYRTEGEGTVMETLDRRRGPSLRSRVWHLLTGPIIVWGVWGAMTVALVLFIQHYTRNLPFMDDFEMVPMMTGQEPVSFGSVWAQHNEHRPVISRLILTGLSRFVANGFYVGKYFNVGLLSVTAASMLLLVRRLRGRTLVTDSVLPLSILNIGQVESLVITFAMNLILSTWITIELIRTASLADRRPGWATVLSSGVLLVLLPLCGGSGLVLLPPLVLWLGGYIAWGWWSGREPGGMARAIGLGALMACSAIVTLYLSGYSRPSYHPPPPSLSAAASTTLACLSLAVCPSLATYWRPAGLLLLLLIGATLLRLAVVSIRVPAERPRALGLLAMILAILGMVVAIGISRSGFGPRMGLSSRYITLTAPLISALYVAWLTFGPAPARRGIHLGLLAVVCLMVPANAAFSMRYGRDILAYEHRFEMGLKNRVPVPELMRRACPSLYPDPKFAYESFKMLKAARVGAFRFFGDARVAAAPDPPTSVRR